MKVYLVRHGEAESKEKNPERPLSSNGAQEVSELARYLKQTHKISVSQVWHSSKLRAKQTAELIVRELELSAPCQEVKGLNPLDDVKLCAQKIESLNENVLIEIGAAMALYGRNFILLVEEGMELPSNLQGLYECRYQGDELSMSATMKLLKVFNEFK